MNSKVISLRGIIHEIVSVFLVIALLSHNAFFSFADNNTSSVGIIYSEDTTIYADDMSMYAEKMSIYSEDMSTYIEEVTYYIEDMVYYQFGEYVDDMYIIALRTQDYIDRNTIIIDPETGYQLNIGSILTKFAIGTTVILVCVALTIATGGTGVGTVAAIALPYVQTVSVGAAVSSALRGSINYIASGGNGEKFLEGVIEGAAEGFMWSAILSPGAMYLAKLQMAKVLQASRSISQVRYFSELAGRTVTASLSYASSVLHAITESELMLRYGNLGKQIYQDINYYTGYGYRIIQNTIRNNLNNPLINEKIARISTFLKDQPLLKNMTLFRGDNVSPDSLAEMYGLKNVQGLTLQQLIDRIKNSQGVYTNPALTSTSAELGDTVIFFATRQTNPNNLKIIRELRISENAGGVHGALIRQISRIPKENEVLLDMGLRTKIIDAYLEEVLSGGELHYVIRIIEEVL